MRTAIIVDDEPIIRLDLSQMLEELDFSVLGAVSDGFDAVELCQKTHPDVVLMDVNMPVFDGLSATEKILSEHLSPCVVIVSGYSDRNTISRAAQLGVSGWLSKPVEKRQLLATLEIALSDTERSAALQQKLNLLQDKLDSMKCIDRAKSILAQQRNVSEAEAYRQMQQLAMEKRCTMSAIAARIVESGSDRETVNRAKALLMQKNSLSETAAYKQLNAYAAKRGVSLIDAARAILSEIR